QGCWSRRLKRRPLLQTSSPTESSTENLHWDWYSKRGHFSLVCESPARTPFPHDGATSTAARYTWGSAASLPQWLTRAAFFPLISVKGFDSFLIEMFPRNFSSWWRENSARAKVSVSSTLSWMLGRRLHFSA